MFFWIATAALTAAATIALLAPLFRKRTAIDAGESEAAIYRDQLEEIDRDVERGVLPESEAKAARAEIARRLIQVADAKAPSASDQPRRRRFAFWGALVAVPVLCVAGYLVLGQPGAGDRPFDNRMVNPADDDLYAQLDLLFQEPTLERVIRVEALLDGASVETRNSARFQEAAAFVYALAGRYGETVVAYNRYVAIGGEAADPNGGYAFVLGETIFRATDGRVTPEAEELFRLSLEGDPADVVARIYLALALQQRGEDEAAVEAYLALLELEPVGGAEWAEVVRAQLAELGVEPPPPPQEEEGFEGLTPEQLEMVNEMVGGLAVRLEENPDDVEGWAQLIRSYMVLERDDEAFAALARAREFFTGNEEAMAIIEEVEAEIARALELE